MNPNWKPLLDALPDSLHTIVTPHLEAWDKNFETQINKVKEEYQAWDAFKEHDPQYVGQAIQMAQNLVADPQKFMNYVNDQWKLGFVSQDQVQQLQQQAQQPDPYGLNEPNEESVADIAEHPAFKALMETVTQLQGTLNQRTEAEEEAAAIAEFETYLGELETKVKAENKPFDRDYVTALMANGMDGDAAVAKYHETLAPYLTPGTNLPNSTTQTQSAPVVQPPVVLSGDGQGSGSGLPSEPVSYGKLTGDQTIDLVTSYLAQAAAENSQG